LSLSVGQRKAAHHLTVEEVDLAKLDQLEADGVALFCWSDVRPVAGVAGYVDWRICGALSEALQGGFFQGGEGEVLMLPVSRRFGPRRIFAFGLGPVGECDRKGYRAACEKAYSVLRRAGVSLPALAAPYSVDQPKLEHAFVDAANQALGGERLVLWVAG
jgi:hypothetical protein